MAVRMQDMDQTAAGHRLDGVLFTCFGLAIPPSKSRPRWTRGDASWVDRQLATSTNGFLLACCYEWRRRYPRREG